MRCKLKEILDERGLSQLKVASESGVTPGSIGRMYRNQLSRIDMSTIDKVTDYLEITNIGDLFELVPERKI